MHESQTRTRDRKLDEVDEDVLNMVNMTESIFGLTVSKFPRNDRVDGVVWTAAAARTLRSTYIQSADECKHIQRHSFFSGPLSPFYSSLFQAECETFGALSIKIRVTTDGCWNFFFVILLIWYSDSTHIMFPEGRQNRLPIALRICITAGTGWEALRACNAIQVPVRIALGYDSDYYFLIIARAMKKEPFWILPLDVSLFWNV